MAFVGGEGERANERCGVGDETRGIAREAAEERSEGLGERAGETPTPAGSRLARHLVVVVVVSRRRVFVAVGDLPRARLESLEGHEERVSGGARGGDGARGDARERLRLGRARGVRGDDDGAQDAIAHGVQEPRREGGERRRARVEGRVGPVHEVGLALERERGVERVVVQRDAEHRAQRVRARGERRDTAPLQRALERQRQLVHSVEIVPSRRLAPTRRLARRSRVETRHRE